MVPHGSAPELTHGFTNKALVILAHQAFELLVDLIIVALADQDDLDQILSHVKPINNAMFAGVYTVKTWIAYQLVAISR